MKRIVASVLAVFLVQCPGMAADWTTREMDLVRSLSIATLPPPPAAPSNRVADDARAAELGRALFFDSQFSGNGLISCAFCHIPDRSFQDNAATARGMGPTSRRTMPLAGAAYSPFLFWDGRADSLWSQALQPLEAAAEHGGDRTAYVHVIGKDYRERYEAIFGPLPDVSQLPDHAGPVPHAAARSAWSDMTAEHREAVTTVFVNMGKAIAAFERTIQPAETPFDDWVASADFPSPGLLDPAEIAGLRLFVGKAGCIDCHNGPLFTNQSFHNTGVPLAGSADIGRAKGVRMVVLSPFNCRGKFSDAGPGECAELRFLGNKGHATDAAFKTPGLRGVATRAPYMHAGQITTLADVVQHYTEAPAAQIGHSELVPLDLSERERRALLRFLMVLE